jgi:hypothetical protein
VGSQRYRIMGNKIPPVHEIGVRTMEQVWKKKKKKEPGEQFTGPTEMDHRCRAVGDHRLGSPGRTEAATSLGPV